MRRLAGSAQQADAGAAASGADQDLSRPALCRGLGERKPERAEQLDGPLELGGRNAGAAVE